MTNSTENPATRQPEAHTHYFFVDEAGDMTMFNRRKQSLYGRAGVSRTFMLGVARIPDPILAHERMEALREALLADP